MPTIVGILTFVSVINTTSERLKVGKFFICRYFSFNKQLKFRAQLSWAQEKKIPRAWSGLNLMEIGTSWCVARQWPNNWKIHVTCSTDFGWDYGSYLGIWFRANARASLEAHSSRKKLYELMWPLLHIAKLEMTQSTAQQNIEQTARTPK